MSTKEKIREVLEKLFLGEINVHEAEFEIDRIQCRFCDECEKEREGKK